MNSTQHMKDPAAGVPHQLLAHLHLISKYRYPITNNPSLETIVGYLLEAPKIMRDLQPVQWQFFEAPPDGSLMLTWQPLEQMGTGFASDGYIWGDTEQTFNSEVRGYTLQMYLHRSGFRPQADVMASHSRRRYRLMPGNPALGLPNPDPSLWLIHYSKAAPRDHIPSASVHIVPVIHAQMQQRRIIQTQGQLARKDFMLHDRSNWPTINHPQAMARPGPPGPPGVAGGHRHTASLSMADATLEEEEDVSRGDVLDFMTPRDISRMRYEQHHEWMEEILESPYATMQIIPTDLGLGRKGELESLTKDFFDAPTTVHQEASPATVGKLEPGKANDFAEQAMRKLAEMQAELDKWSKRHARRMAKLQRTTTLNAAEKKLRAAPNSSTDEGLSDAMIDGISEPALSGTAEEIVQTVENALGRKVVSVTNVTCISKGGLEDRYSSMALTGSSAGRSVPSPVKTAMSPGPTIDAANQQGQRDQQQYSPAHAAAPTSPPSLPIAALTSDTSAEVVANREQPPMEPIETMPEESDLQQGDEDLDDNMGADIDMSGFDEDDQDMGAEDGGNEWVIVGDQSEQHAHDTENNDEGPVAQELHDSSGLPSGFGLTPEEQQEGSAFAGDNQQQQQEQQHQRQDEAPQVQQVPPPPQQEGEDVALETGDFDMGNDFDNIDTAGDALADYNTGDDDLDLENMDDSAFGDAFHPADDDEPDLL